MILQIDKKNNKFEKTIEESKFSDFGIKEREHLEEWIYKHPEILGEDLLIVAKEYDGFDKTNNRLDLLAIDRMGKIVVIELKRDLADKFVDLQAIHYAAYCSTLNYNHIVKIMSDFTKKSINNIEKEINEFIENEDFTDFDNQPRIILVASNYSEETLAAVLWLRDSSIDITCVKLEPYKIEDKIVIKPEIIVPLPEAKNFMMQMVEKNKNRPEINRWDEQSFMENLENNSSLADVEIAKKIYDWAKENAEWIYWGQGIKTGSFVPGLTKKGVGHQFFNVLTNGKISIYLDGYSHKKPFKSSKKMKELQNLINSVEGIYIPDESLKKRPSFDIAVLKDEKELNKFLETFEWVIKEITN